MMGWLLFLLALGAFFLSHTIPLRPKIKARLKADLGSKGFTLAYSSVSFAALAALILSAQNAPYVELWSQAIWQRYAVLIGMFAVCVIAALAFGRPNPFSFGGAQNERFDPERAGIVRLTRHPLLIALTLWAGLHVLANGDLAHVILFGVFAAFSLLGRGIIDRRKKRLMGDAEWQALLKQMKCAPIFQRPKDWKNTGLRLSVAALVYACLIVSHPILLGVSPLPF